MVARLFPAATASRSSCCGASLRSALLLAACLTAGLTADPLAAADKAKITGLTDVSFGTLTNLTVDAKSSQSVCVYSSSPTGGYNVTASGTGSGGALALQSGADNLPFDVLWNSSPNQTSGTQLTANSPMSGFISTAQQQGCNSGPTASITVVLRAVQLSTVTQGSYSGILTLTIAPE